MSDIVFQGEIFPSDSHFNSSNHGRSGENKIAHTNEKTGRNTKDITGQRFGILTAVEKTEERFGSGVVWLLSCDCGHEVKGVIGHLTRKDSPLNHCGCLGVGKTHNPRPGSRAIEIANSFIKSVWYKDEMVVVKDGE